MTLRDLFRWAERYRLAEVPGEGVFYDWSQHLADHGKHRQTGVDDFMFLEVFNWLNYFFQDFYCLVAE
jgi:hypothetical protein